MRERKSNGYNGNIKSHPSIFVAKKAHLSISMRRERLISNYFASHLIEYWLWARETKGYMVYVCGFFREKKRIKNKNMYIWQPKATQRINNGQDKRSGSTFLLYWVNSRDIYIDTTSKIINSRFVY